MVRPLVLLCAVSLAAFAGKLTPAELAQIQVDQKKAEAEVNAKHGNKPSSEMTPGERKEVIVEQQSAAKNVYAQHGVTPKDVARQEATLTQDERQQLQAAKDAIQAKEDLKAAQKDLQKNADATGDVEIVRGTSDETPVELYKEDGAVDVDRPDENGVSTNLGDVSADLPADGPDTASPPAK